MKQRCLNPNNPKYPAYGGSGISVCEDWLSFERFLADMGERPAGTTIDRIDGALGYFNGNCRWATIHEQQNNVRTNRRVEYAGRSVTVAELATELGLERNTLYYRIDAGWPPEDWGVEAWQGNRH
jgi:hypothetical protein